MKIRIRRGVHLPIDRKSFNSLIGGGEGGLATTTAIISGLLVSTSSRELVVTIAFISFLVQGFNGAVSRYSAERTADEIEGEDKKSGYRKPLFDAFIQLFSHIIMSLLVIAPVILVPDIRSALIYSIGTTLLILFLIGAYKAKIVKRGPLSDGMEMLILGALVISIGTIAGYALR